VTAAGSTLSKMLLSTAKSQGAGRGVQLPAAPACALWQPAGCKGVQASPRWHSHAHPATLLSSPPWRLPGVNTIGIVRRPEAVKEVLEAG
jgi:hypothetical protein